MTSKFSMNRINRRRAIQLTGASMGAACLPACGPGATETVQSPDLIIHNATIITNDPAAPRAEALALRNGLFTAVGQNKDITNLSGPNTRVINANGRTLIPGLNDSHQHPTRAGRFYATELRWDGLTSLKRGLEMIREAAAVTPPGQWVRVVGGWSPYQFTEKRLPTPAELTEAAPDTPVFVLFLYSQGYLNAAGVRSRKIGPSTPAPDGTRYEFTADGGAILHADPNPDLLYGSIGALPSLKANELELSTQYYYRELNRFGLTSVIDAGGGGHSFPENYTGTFTLAQNQKLTMRISKYLFPQNKGREYEEFEKWIHDFELNDNMAPGLAHGYEVEGAGEFLAWSAGDYENFLAGRPDITTRSNWHKHLINVTRLMMRNGWPLRIHATYDESANNILDVFSEADSLERAEGRTGLGGIRWAMDHGETYTDDTIARLKKMGGGMAVQSRMAFAGEFFLERYGAQAAANAPRLQSMRQAGLPLGLGSDATRVASYNPWNTLYWATSGRSVGGTQLLGEDQTLTREEALFHHTKGSAWFSQEEHEKGAVRVGEFADFALLDRPYLEVSDEDMKNTLSDMTVLAGKAVHASGDFKAYAPPPLPEIKPDWSPVRLFGGYQK